MSDAMIQTPEREEVLSRAEREALAVASDPILAQMLREERVEAAGRDTALIGRLFGYLVPHWRTSVVAVLLSIVEAAFVALPPFIVGLAIDRISNRPRADGSLAWLTSLLDDLGARFVALVGGAPGAIEPLVVWFGVAVAGLWLVRWAFAIVTVYLVQYLGQRVVHDLRVEVYRHITGMHLGFFHQNPIGRLVNRTTFDLQALSDLFSNAFASVMKNAILIVVLLGFMLWIDPWLALVPIVAFPVLIAAALVYRHLARPALRTNSAVQSRMNAWLAENLAGMRENHLYRREGRRAAEFESLTRAHQDSIARVIRAWCLLRPAMMLTCGVATAAVLAIGYGRVKEGLAVGVLVSFLQYISRLWAPVREVAEKFQVIQTALTSGERVMDVLDTPTEMTDPPGADPALTVEAGAIQLDSVRFRYDPDAEEDVLKGIDLRVEPGRFLALVGDTGAGKTTVVNLISRFYDATSGTVRVDGRDVREYTLKGLRRGIAIVPQDVVIFAGTVRENVTLGLDVSDDRIRECLAAVCADRFVRRLPGGLDHVMEEGGKTLSSGERQLLSFARALVTAPPILILDEATANVDTHTELLIQRALENLLKGRTSVVIAHRLSTVRAADEILVLHDGMVVERGDHDSLLDREGEYARLYRLHLGRQAG